VSLADKTTRTVTGSALTLSGDGSAIAWITRDADTYTLNAAPAATAQPAVIPIRPRSAGCAGALARRPQRRVSDDDEHGLGDLRVYA
jgi:hypothetical protein